MTEKEIIYYTDSALKHDLLEKWCKDTIRASKLPVVSVALRKEADIGRPLVLHGYRGHTNIYIQVLMGLITSEAKYVFLCEHDVLYHPSHFDFAPPRDDRYYYNNNVWKYRLSDRKVIGYDCHWASQLCCNRKLLIKHMQKRFRMIADGKRAYGWEPGTGQSKKIDNIKAENWESEYPNIDVRHGRNFTGTKRMSRDEFRNLHGCPNWKESDVHSLPGWDAEELLKL